MRLWRQAAPRNHQLPAGLRRRPETAAQVPEYDRGHFRPLLLASDQLEAPVHHLLTPVLI